MIRVAFTPIGGKQWTGGRNYQLNLFRALSRHQTQHITPVLFVGEDSADGEIDSFAAISGVEVVRTMLMNPSRRIKELAWAVAFGRDVPIRRMFQQRQIDVVFEPARFFGWRLGIPAIAWIPDFLHKALPETFDPAVWWKREVGFRLQVFSKRLIMLSSETARLECERYYPAARGRTRAVPFAVPSARRMSMSEARAVASAYGLPETYFFLPNQFWRHKNHLLVLDALEILRKRGKRPVIAASGNQYDPHAPEYFTDFHRRLDAAGLGESFRLLGMIPYADLAPLLFASAALVNPSLFEGWSTTVEEARALGTPMLLSDLPVHREQMGAEAQYFDPHSANSLADALDHFEPLGAHERVHRYENARERAEPCVAKFAAAFAALCEFSLLANSR